jgi:anti-sigma B factor antagonist
MSGAVQNQNSETIRPVGNIIAVAARELRQQMQQLIDSGTCHITVDMGSVELVDSTGIGVLIGIQNNLKPKNGTLKLVNVGDDIQKMFKIMRLDKHINIVNSN